ncbi:MAG: zinc ribbon domain-containing protein, partial [bacterium]
MKNILYNLIALQEVDNELQALEDLKGNLPQQVKELQEEVTVLKSKFEKQKNDLEEMRRTKLHWERELTDLQNKLKKYQDQLYSVTTNRQYDAITVEIDDIKEKISEAETKIIDF